MTFHSTPPNAKVATTNGFGCAATPCTISLPRDEQFTAKLTLDGYETSETFIRPEHKLGAMMLSAAGNLLFGGGLVGFFIDGFTGAAFDLSPNPLSVELQPISAVGLSEANEVSVYPTI